MFNENFKIRHLIAGSIAVAVWLYVLVVVIPLILG
jgi:hypothetical protein